MRKRRLYGKNTDTDNQKEKELKKSKTESVPKNEDKKENNEKGNEEELIIYSKFIQEVISEINFARTKPSEYAAKLERISSTLSGRKVKVGKSTMKLKEGAAIFDETIQYLLNIGQMEPLELCEGLSESANELLSILIIQEGVDMSDFNLDIYDLEHRLDHFGVYFGEFSELIDYGSFDPEFVVVNFLLSDGDETRNDRHTVMNPLMKYCGITSGILPSTKKCTILNFVQHYFKPGEEIPDKMLQTYTYKPNVKDQFRELNGQIGQVFFDKKNRYNQKYNMNSYTFINDENGQVSGKKPKKIKKITKKFKDKVTGKEIVTVKTIITYIDGEEVVDNYVL
jgi:hypothetical protein